MRSLLLLALSGFALLACSSADAPTPAATSGNQTSTGHGGSGGEGAGGGAGMGGAGGAGGCPADAHIAMGGACVSEIEWAPGPTLPIPRNHQMTWLVDTGSAAFLYVAGGSDATSTGLSDIERATIGTDGTLGAWEKTAPLPEAIIGAGVVLTHNEVIIAGGYGIAKSWTSAIQPDGSMGKWVAGPLLPGPWFHTSAVVFQNFVYVIGGLNGTTEINQVVRSSIAADGSLGVFQSAATLPYALSHHASIVNDTTLYVLGGETTDGVPRNDVLSAPLAADGTLGAWKHETSLPFAVETHSTFIHDGSIYAMGGIRGGTLASVADVVLAPIGSGGTLGVWTDDMASKLPHARSHVHQTPIYKTFIYSVAGAPTGFPSTTGISEVGTFH